MLAGLLFAGFHSGFGASSEAPTEPLTARVTKALTEKKADDRLKKLRSIGAILSIQEIPEALTLLDTLNELRAHAVLHDAIVKRWAQLAPAQAWAYVAQLPEGRGKLELVRTTAAVFAQQDPAQAAAAVVAITGARSRIEAIALVAETWAKADVPAALQWTRRLPSGPAQEAALYNIRFIWVHSDPATASADVQQLPPNDTRRALIMNIAGEWAARDPQQAIGWAHKLTDNAEQEAAFSNIAESWADTHPPEAGAFALQLPPEFRAPAALAVVARWATQDPQAAAIWALQIPDDAVQNRGLTEVLNVWTSVDPAAAGVWVQSLTPAPLHDAAIQAYVEAVLEWAPDVATRIALATVDPAQRWSRVENCLNHWAEIDPASARQWLEAAALPLENKQRWCAAPGHG